MLIYIHLRKYTIWIVPLLMSFLLPACSLFRETAPMPTPDPSSIVQTTPDEIAKAMQDDHFYSDYRGLTLSIKAIAASIDLQGNDWMINLQTTEPEKVFCDLGSQKPDIKTGDAIVVLAAASDAQRGNSSMILGNCSLK
jgi:hypothetical protein